jgi:hypothetical protein
MATTIAEVHDPVAGLLGRRCSCRVFGDAEEVYPSGRDLHHERDVRSALGDGVEVDEAGGEQSGTPVQRRHEWLASTNGASASPSGPALWTCANADQLSLVEEPAGRSLQFAEIATAQTRGSSMSNGPNSAVSPYCACDNRGRIDRGRYCAMLFSVVSGGMRRRPWRAPECPRPRTAGVRLHE